MATQRISVAYTDLLNLNTVIPTIFRTPFPVDANGSIVINQAIHSLSGARTLAKAQEKEIAKLKKELFELKAKAATMDIAHSPKFTPTKPIDRHATQRQVVQARDQHLQDSQTLLLRTLTSERTDYHYCTMQLMMYITGEGTESRGPTIDFAKLREVLEAARQGGWTLKQLANGIEWVVPADKEIIRGRREKWEGVSPGKEKRETVVAGRLGEGIGESILHNGWEG